jgi:glycosyltransferase involved in cell wall biosynthesis
LDKSGVFVSFIMPHHGRDALLIETIQSIQALDGMGETISAEAIVVTRDIDFNKHQILTQLCGLGVEVPVKIINITQDKTISHARNHGASMATGEYLAFVDSDVRLSTNWVAEMVSSLQPGVVLASAVQVPDRERCMNDVIRSAMSAANVGDDVESLPGANLFMRRSVFEHSDKFPEHLQTCEDSWFTHSLLDKGKLVLTDQTGFVHLGEDLTLGNLFKKEIWRGKSNIDLLFSGDISASDLPGVIVPFILLLSPLFLVITCTLGYLSCTLYTMLFALLPCVMYALRLKLRSGVKLGLHKLVTFYLIYFFARGVGMVQRLSERNGLPLHVGARPR